MPKYYNIPEWYVRSPKRVDAYIGLVRLVFRDASRAGLRNVQKLSTPGEDCPFMPDDWDTEASFSYDHAAAFAARARSHGCFELGEMPYFGMYSLSPRALRWLFRDILLACIELGDRPTAADRGFWLDWVLSEMSDYDRWYVRFGEFKVTEVRCVRTLLDLLPLEDETPALLKGFWGSVPPYPLPDDDWIG